MRRRESSDEQSGEEKFTGEVRGRDFDSSVHGREIRGEDSRVAVWGYHRRRFRELVRRVFEAVLFGGVQTGEERGYVFGERRDESGGIQGCRNGSGGVLHRRARHGDLL